MPNTKRTDKIQADIAAARAAIDTIERALQNGDAERMAHVAAKTLEAFGCYVRRTPMGD